MGEWFPGILQTHTVDACTSQDKISHVFVWIPFKKCHRSSTTLYKSKDFLEKYHTPKILYDFKSVTVVLEDWHFHRILTSNMRPSCSHTIKIGSKLKRLGHIYFWIMCRKYWRRRQAVLIHKQTRRVSLILMSFWYDTNCRHVSILSSIKIGSEFNKLEPIWLVWRKSRDKKTFFF